MQTHPEINLMIGLPVYGGYHPHFVPGLLDLMRRPPCNLRMAPVVGDSLVSRARNRIAAKFLQHKELTHLLFLDTDLIFNALHVGRLISHKIPFVVGMYPKKQEKLAWVCNTRADFPPKDPETGLQRILYGGTGCMLIAREVFEAIIEKFPDLAYDPDDGEEDVPLYDFFKVGVHKDVTTGRRRYLSEDWFFCQLAQEAGFNLMADTHVVLKHCGDAIFPLTSSLNNSEAINADGLKSREEIPAV